MADSGYSVEVHFAQRLAANEKKIRDRAVKRLRQWIVARSRKENALSEDELMRLWKGMFYCMWMCDKPVIQEELADQISDMVHCFQQPQQAVTFYDTYLLTMKREWIGIDHLRMDKFLMLVRRAYRQMLVLLHNNDWDQSLLQLFLNSLRRSVLNPAMDGCPDGLRYQLAHVYLDELAREGTEELTPQQASSFLAPFAELVAKTLNKKLRDVMLEDIFQDVVERSNVGEEKEEEEEEDEGIASDEDRTKKSDKKKKGHKTAKKRRRKGDQDEDEDEDEDDEEEEDVDILEKVMFPEEMVPPLEYDYGAIADMLFKQASEKNIPARNRKPVYRMVTRFQSLAKGIYPMRNLLEEIRNEKDNDYLQDDLPWWKKLQAIEKAKKKKKRRKRRRGKKGAKGGDGDDDDDDGEEDTIDDDDEEEVARKRPRKMGKETALSGHDAGRAREEDEVETEAVETESKKKKKKKTKRKTSGESNTADMAEDDGTNESRPMESDETKPSKSKRKLGGKANLTREDGATESSDKESLVEARLQAAVEGDKRAEAAEDDFDMPMKSKKNKKKHKKAAAISEDAPTPNADTDATPKLEVVPADKDAVLKSPFLVDSSKKVLDGHQENEDVPAETPRRKSKKGKKSKKMTLTESDTGVPEMGDDVAMPTETPMEINMSRGKDSTEQKSERKLSVFASFQKVETPVAYVKKSKHRSEVPSTLPRAKAKSKAQPQYTPPMTRKRVKIALSLNQFQGASDYRQSVKASPGVPFDGTKKPAHSALKPTPERPASKASKTSAKVAAKAASKRRRSQAVDFF
ncbi:uncharacterized protein [Diadema antillarum]|uniref:uncharacterized protein n=1 Tax=Diadema antillarum TaxID=105358 RepID=UPI003A877BBE